MEIHTWKVSIEAPVGSSKQLFWDALEKGFEVLSKEKPYLKGFLIKDIVFEHEKEVSEVSIELLINEKQT